MPRGNPGQPKSEQHRKRIAAAAKLRAARPECFAQLQANGKKSTAFLVENNKRRGLPQGIASKRALFRRYLREAKERRLTWALTNCDFDALVAGYCHYCGEPPMQVHSAGSQVNGAFIYNGIDRRDNAIGYEITNCVSCCGRCNWWKGEMSQEEFYNHVSKISCKQQALSSARGK